MNNRSSVNNLSGKCQLKVKKIKTGQIKQNKNKINKYVKTS